MKLGWLLPAVAAFALAGCAGAPKVDSRDETVSLVYGYFDMKHAPSTLEWVSLRKYGTPKEGEWYSLAAKDGLFFHIGVEPGSYQVDKFGGTGGIPLLTRRPFEYDFGAKGRNRTALRIAKPGLYFLGTYRYVNHAGKGLLEADKFEMQPSKSPGEKDVLQRLVKELESDKSLSAYTRQLQLAKKRLAEL